MSTKYLSVREVAIRYGLTEGTVRYKAGYRSWPELIKIKGRLFFLAADLDLMDQNSPHPISPTAPVNCGFCGILFTPKLHSHYCSQSCRQKGARKRHKEHLARVAEMQTKYK